MRKIIENYTPIFLIFMVAFSIIVTYYSKMVLKDYDILYTETGLPELDEE